jgi:drug/metabolite transporter (DMT)-like permease
MRIVACTLLALIAFAANSVLCRLALRDGAIDPASFSAIRLATGATTLLLARSRSGGGNRGNAGSWIAASMLFLYAVPFSFAYTKLTTGTGALILFGCVQVTMLAAAWWLGERPHPLQWSGLAVALAGLLVLVLPGLAAPSLSGAALMGIAGVSWGVYSLLGRGAKNPLSQTSGNFLRTVPLVAAVSLLSLPRIHVEVKGALLAVASGAIASGIGYVLWYAALSGLTATRAAVSQLAVPVLTAASGVVFLSEAVTGRLILSSTLILGGIALALAGREGIGQDQSAGAQEAT